MMSRGFPSALSARTRRSFTLFWAALFVMSLGLQYGSLASPSNALALTGAIYTSNVDGTIINANSYPSKSDVYLTGGPCQGESHLAPGDYYFQITIPTANGALLSTDAIGNRMFTVGANGFITSTTGTHTLATVGCTGVTGFTIQLIPFADTTNSGGEYKLTIATASSVKVCDGFVADSISFQICGGADSKSDNFKVAKDFGSLKISKTITGDLAGFLGGTFGFSVDCGIDGTHTTSITIAQGSTGGIATISNIPASALCTISETSKPDPATDFTWGTVTISPNPVTISGNSIVNVDVGNPLTFHPRPGLAITKGVSLTNGSGYVASVTTTVGTTVFYRIVVSNTGNVPLTSVTLTDSLYNNGAPPCAAAIPTSLAVGASFTCDYSRTAAVGTTTNTATAASEETDSVNASATVTVAAGPGLAITKGVSLSAAGPFVASLTGLLTGTTVHYQITVMNTGNVALTSVQLADDHYTLVSLGCTIPTSLAVGASFTCSYSATAPDGTTKNTATASATYVEQTVSPVQASATIVARTSILTVAKAVAGNTNGIDPILNVPSAKFGDTLTFTLTYTLGSGPVTNAVITDVLPQGYGAPTAISNDGTGAPGTWNATTRSITWKWATLSASGAVSYKVVVLTGADALAQPLTNVASIVSDQTAPASASREVAVAGQVLAATSTPRVTPPPTDTSSVPQGSGTGNNLMLVLLALAGFGLFLGFVTPKPARARQRNRRD